MATFTVPISKTGEFIRPTTVFRNHVSSDKSAKFPVESGRYHLFVAHACPWAHRTLIMRKLKGLEDSITYSVVHPLLPATGGWYFGDYPGSTPLSEIPDGYKSLKEVYLATDPNYEGRVSVPVLYDKKQKLIVNNESIEIVKMFNSEFNSISKKPELDLYPENLKKDIDEQYDFFYNGLNNAVYKCGFATSQEAYDKAVNELFNTLDVLEKRLETNRFIWGDKLTINDICVWTTLYRFDPVYVTHFKCNWKRLKEYPNIWGYTLDIYQENKLKEICNLDQVKYHYFYSHTSINPHRIIPKGLLVDYDAPHDRKKLIKNE